LSYNKEDQIYSKFSNKKKIYISFGAKEETNQWKTGTKVAGIDSTDTVQSCKTKPGKKKLLLFFFFWYMFGRICLILDKAFIKGEILPKTLKLQSWMQLKCFSFNNY